MSKRTAHETVAALLALLSLLGGWPAAVPGRLGAELRFRQTRCEVGEVRGGSTLTAQFAFANVGTTPVEIVEVRPGCGCLKPRLWQRLVQPGETGRLELEIDTRRESAGPHVWQLTVRWQRGAVSQETTLRVSGRVLTEVTVQPAALTLLADEPGNAVVLLTDLRGMPLTLRSVSSSSPRLTAVAQTPQMSPLHHQTWEIRLSQQGEWPPGRHEEKVTIYTDDVDYPSFEVPVTVVKHEAARVQARPKSVLFTLAPGQQSQRTVTLRDRHGQPVLVESVRADHEALTVSAQTGPAGEATLTIGVDGGKVPVEGMSSAVRVQLQAPTRETVVVLVDCTRD